MAQRRQERRAGRPGKIRLDVDRISVPLHPGAEAAFSELGKAEDAAAPAPEPQPNATN